MKIKKPEVHFITKIFLIESELKACHALRLKAFHVTMCLLNMFLRDMKYCA